VFVSITVHYSAPGHNVNYSNIDKSSRRKQCIIQRCKIEENDRFFFICIKVVCVS